MIGGLRRAAEKRGSTGKREHLDMGPGLTRVEKSSCFPLRACLQHSTSTTFRAASRYLFVVPIPTYLVFRFRGREDILVLKYVVSFRPAASDYLLATTIESTFIPYFELDQISRHRPGRLPSNYPAQGSCPPISRAVAHSCCCLDSCSPSVLWAFTLITDSCFSAAVVLAGLAIVCPPLF